MQYYRVIISPVYSETLGGRKRFLALGTLEQLLASVHSQVNRQSLCFTKRSRADFASVQILGGIKWQQVFSMWSAHPTVHVDFTLDRVAELLQTHRADVQSLAPVNSLMNLEIVQVGANEFSHCAHLNGVLSLELSPISFPQIAHLTHIFIFYIIKPLTIFSFLHVTDPENRQY